MPPPDVERSARRYFHAVVVVGMALTAGATACSDDSSDGPATGSGGASGAAGQGGSAGNGFVSGGGGDGGSDGWKGW